MTTVTAAQVQEVQSAVGRTQTRTEVLDAESLRRFAVAIHEDLDVERIYPSLGHWAFFLPIITHDQLTVDGASRGSFLPTIPLPRRMFGGASFRFDTPLVLGRSATQVSTIASVEHKSGRSGELVILEVEDVISQDGATCVTERRTLIYRDEGEPPAPVSPRPQPQIAGDEFWQPSPIDLFRFSAVTFNSHRIHYDAVYTTEREGYPGLVVQGPFTAAKLFGFARRRAGSQPNRFSFRAQAPLFVSQPVRLSKGDEADTVTAIRCDGSVAVTATAGFTET